MLTALLLLSIPWSTIGPAIGWLVGGLTLAERAYNLVFGGTSKRLDKLEAAVASFVPEDDIKAEHKKLGEQIADNQAKIKTQHDRTEDAINALNSRTASLEQHNTSLTLLPGEVNNLKTDHRVLASKVDTLTDSVGKLSEKQDRHHSELMQAVRDSAYTRGELHGGRQRPTDS